MSVRIEFEPNAERDLAAIWTDAEDRDRITEAVSAAERILADARRERRAAVRPDGRDLKLILPPLRFYFTMPIGEDLVIVRRIESIGCS